MRGSTEESPSTLYGTVMVKFTGCIDWYTGTPLSSSTRRHVTDGSTLFRYLPHAQASSPLERARERRRRTLVMVWV
jgi:hypothetical protein